MGFLSKSFTLEELTATNTGLPNIPDDEATEKMLYLATYILQPIRDKFGPVVVNSCYRSAVVNKAVGGVETSQHRKGEAADIDVPGVNLGMVFAWAKSNLKYGQCIDEKANGKAWLHISLPRIGGLNMQAMTMREGKYELA